MLQINIFLAMYLVSIKAFNTVVNSQVIALNDIREIKNYQVIDLNIFLSKSLDNEGLKPRILKAFYLLFKLHGNDLNKTEKF